MAETNSKKILFQIESCSGSLVDITSSLVWKTREPYIENVRMTDVMLNDAIASMPEDEKIIFLRQIFGEEWEQHYDGNKT